MKFSLQTAVAVLLGLLVGAGIGLVTGAKRAEAETRTPARSCPLQACTSELGCGYLLMHECNIVAIEVCATRACGS